MKFLELKRELEAIGQVMTDKDVLWTTSAGESPRLAIPSDHVPEMLALVHGTYAHPGVGRTYVAITSRRFFWPPLARDIRDCVLSCGCRQWKYTASQRVAMLSARFLHLREVFYIVTEDMI